MAARKHRRRIARTAEWSVRRRALQLATKAEKDHKIEEQRLLADLNTAER
jgi:hypothetical protein